MPDATPEFQHCRICHRDTSDFAKHFKLHHEASGGFASTCNEFICPKEARKKASPAP